MDESIYIEINCKQYNCKDNVVCGDVFLSNRIDSECRVLAVLSDGMGSGIKAGVLAMLTSSMALNFVKEHRSIRETAEIIMDTLPVCSERNISYSTFTIVDIDFDYTVHIVEYDNPSCIIMRGGNIFTPRWEQIELSGEKHKDKVINICQFQAQIEDRIIIMTDGVVQSGMGSLNHPFGWGHDEVELFIKKTIKRNVHISASELSGNIVNEAVNFYDLGTASDDTSSAVIYFRLPRELLVCTGPPYRKEYDHEFSKKFKDFQGKKIICGGTTIDIITRHLGLNYFINTEVNDDELPPEVLINGVSLATEGILTLCKAAKMLEEYNTSTSLGTGPADKIVSLFINSDKIHFIVGTGINKAHQDPIITGGMDIRRNIVNKIADILTNKFLKQVSLEFI